MLLFFFIIHIVVSSSKSFIITKPTSAKYSTSLPLFWKIANKNELQCSSPKKIVFNDFPIAIYKDKFHKFVAISDICVHRGASLSCGTLLNNNCLQCPYHGWEYKNGLVENIPGCPDVTGGLFGAPQFELKELNDDIFMRPTYDINSNTGITYNHTIYIPPEASDKKFVRISGKLCMKRPFSMVTENVLDMMHISYVHSFGNPLSPVPFKIQYEDLDPLSGKTTFHYTSGFSSMSRRLGGAKFVIVENEFHLPDTTVTRVTANHLVKTIITHCYPVSKTESILHYELYRNFLTSHTLNPLFHSQMIKALHEDINIMHSVYDDYFIGFMSNKYDITQLNYRKKMKWFLKNETDIN